MRRFEAIEGLRGWLAWTVVLSHLTAITCVYALGIGPIINRAGGCAVVIFIIVSGFVITHLVEKRTEAYSVYILRRFMRIFPVFAVTCMMGYFAYDMLYVELIKLPWAYDQAYSILSIINIDESNHKYFWSNVFLHLTMLHGVVGNNFLPNSEYAFNGPAWSLSLEWQFYIIAPFAVRLAHKGGNPMPIALILLSLGALCRIGLFGRFDNTSVLPGMAGYFAIGILTRIHYQQIVRSVHAYKIYIIPLTLVLLPLDAGLVPLLVWLLVLCGLPIAGVDESNVRFARIYEKLLESRVALYFGARSYSIYLCHYLVIDSCYALWLKMFPVPPGATTSFAVTAPAMLGVTAMTVPATIVLSELLYRGVEMPGIWLGSVLAGRLQSWLLRREARQTAAVPVTGEFNLRKHKPARSD